MLIQMTYPKIELHVHLDSTMRPPTLLRLAHRNGYTLPFKTAEEFVSYCRPTNFHDFGRIWFETTGVLEQERDFREVLVAYAAEAASHGAVYVEAIFNPMTMWRRGTSLEAIFKGYCEGIEEAREVHGVEFRLTPDADLWGTREEAEEIARYAVVYRDKGVVGFGVSGPDQGFDSALFKRASQMAREGGLGFTPHAGEFGGAKYVRTAVETLGACRVRHGLGAIEDHGLMREIAAAGIGFDICPISNIRVGAVASLEQHPVRAFVAAGIRCSVSSDDPALLDTDLGRDHEAARSLGLTPKMLYEAALGGVLCDHATQRRLKSVGSAFDWASVGG